MRLGAYGIILISDLSNQFSKFRVAVPLQQLICYPLRFHCGDCAFDGCNKSRCDCSKYVSHHVLRRMPIVSGFMLKSMSLISRAGLTRVLRRYFTCACTHGKTLKAVRQVYVEKLVSTIDGIGRLFLRIDTCIDGAVFRAAHPLPFHLPKVVGYGLILVRR